MTHSTTRAALAGLIVGAALALSGAAAAQEPTKVGFVYVGPVGDFGWTYRHNQGRLAVEAAFGDAVETTYVENVAEGPDAERVIRQLAATGNDIIFTTSFGFMNPTIRVAQQFPDVAFEHATGYQRADNVSTYIARFYEGRYVIGVMAGRMTESNTIGYIASFPIPEVVRGINSFVLGLHSVNPDANVKVVWVNTWYDPGKESDAAKALIDQGADIIVQHTDSPAALQVAQERGVHGFGQASDMTAFAPEAQLTAIIDNWDTYYISRVQAVMDGTWESTATWDGIAAGMVTFAPYGPAVPDEVAAEADDLIAAIASGEVQPFAGPIYNQDGELIAAEGEVVDDGVLAGMDFYIQGVDATMPN